MKLEIPTTTRAGAANINGYVYTKENFDEAVEKSKEALENGTIKFAHIPIWCRAAIDSIELSIPKEFVLGTVRKIYDDKIVIDVCEDNAYAKILVSGVEAGEVDAAMVYAANSNVDGGKFEATIKKIVCFYPLSCEIRKTAESRAKSEEENKSEA